MPFADQARQKGVKVLQLNIGQPDLPTPAVMRERLKLVPEVIAYSPSQGEAPYLASLAKYYQNQGLPIEAKDLITTTGGSEAILFSFMACADHGEEGLVVEPFYTNYSSFAEMAGVHLVPLASQGEDGFHLPPLDVWESKLTPKTKFVILCNPNNPTGTVFTEEELKMVAEFCQAHDLFLISDEVYREFVYDGRKAVSLLSMPEFQDRVIVVDSLSKRYSACGIRLGSLATHNLEVYQVCLHMAQGRLSPPGLAQLIALGAEDIEPGYFESVAIEYQARRDTLYDGLTRIPGAFLRKPEGAFYFILRLPVADSEDFCRFLLSDFSHEGHTVLLAPAPGFYATPGLGKNEVRIAYVRKREDLEISVRVIDEALKVYPGRV